VRNVKACIGEKLGFIQYIDFRYLVSTRYDGDVQETVTIGLFFYIKTLPSPADSWLVRPEKLKRGV
jgi:hypothetical protein